MNITSALGESKEGIKGREEIIGDTEEPYRVGGFVIAKDLLCLIVVDEEEEE